MKDLWRFAVLAAGCAVFLLAGCEERKETVPTTVYDKTEMATKEKPPGEPVLLPEQRQEFLDSAQARLARLDEQLSELRAKMADLPETARNEFAPELERLNQAKDAAQENLRKLREAGTEAWQQAQDGVASALTDLEAGIGQFADRLQKP